MICAETVLNVVYICCEKLCSKWLCLTELSGIRDLTLNKDALFKDAFAMEPYLV